MGEVRSVAHLPVGTFLVNFFHDDPGNGWEVGHIEQGGIECVFIRGEGKDVYLETNTGEWSLEPIWNVAVTQDHPAYDLLMAVVAALHMGNEPLDLIEQIKEILTCEA